MKATLAKHSDKFFIDLVPETPEEVLQLVRFGINKTKTLKSARVYVSETVANTGLSIVIGAKKSESNTL